MRLTELLLLAVLGWSALGVVGVAVRFLRGEPDVARRHARWLIAVWLLYAAALAGISLLQPQRVVTLGADQCFDEMCFAVLDAAEVHGLVPGETGRIVRVTIRVRNHGHKTEAEGLIEAYLVDRQGRRWQPLPGLGGNPLNARVAGQSEMLSQPVFQVAKDATGLKLVLTHGRWQPGRLVLGDSDSLGHKRTVVRLDQLDH